MTEDRSLEEFTGERSADDAKSEKRDAEPSDGADADASAAVATYRWDPEGVDCAACGESAERLWNADGGFVCEACKEW